VRHSPQQSVENFALLFSLLLSLSAASAKPFPASGSIYAAGPLPGRGIAGAPLPTLPSAQRLLPAPPWRRRSVAAFSARIASLPLLYSLFPFSGGHRGGFLVAKHYAMRAAPSTNGCRAICALTFSAWRERAVGRLVRFQFSLSFAIRVSIAYACGQAFFLLRRWPARGIQLFSPSASQRQLSQRLHHHFAPFCGEDAALASRRRTE